MFVICLAFVTGIVFTMAHPTCGQSTATMNATTHNQTTLLKCNDFSFKNVFNWVSWSIFSLGPKNSETESSSDIRTEFSRVVALFYQVIIATVLLNLLIAIMNYIVARSDNNKFLYWKFYKTSLALEFFDQDYSNMSSTIVPLTIPLMVVECILYLVERCCPSYNCCNRNSTEERRRTAYPELMRNLTERLLQKTNSNTIQIPSEC